MAYGDMQTMNGTMQIYQQNRSMETVSLSRLIDFSIQRTYHELTVLTELLPRKSDMERKIEIVTFVNRTKQLFIRLLALVKWAGSASKVEKCSTIVSFLDKQAMLFTETADTLAKMSRENLSQARLPNFQLPSAVEILTSGTYTRLPSCIRDRIVPPDPITPEEKKMTLIRLNQIIQQRLVSTNLPYQMRNLKIEYGRVVFHIPFEFELTLTLMGDKLQIPWRVLNVIILVEDKETGEGKDLVHSLQTNFLQHLVQEKLTESSRPLFDAFDILHSFCSSLQLEVLHAQTIRLSRERLGDFLKVDEYQLGSRLVISYWKDQIVENNIKGCKLVIEIKNQDQNDSLIVSHLPELGDNAELANQAIKSDVLSIEKLLICTTHERARKILLQFCEKFENTKYGKTFNYEICGLPPVLQISYLQPCMDSEKLTLSVDVLTGLIMVHIAQFDNCPFLDEIQQSIKKDLINFENLINDLRIWVTKERFKKTAEYFFSTVQEQLPFTPKEQNPIIRNKHQKLYFQFLKNVDYYLVAVFTDQTDNNNVHTDYYLINVEPANIEYENKFKTDFDELHKSFLSIKSLIKLNSNCILKSSDKQLNEEKSRKFFSIKRKFDEIDGHYSSKNDKINQKDSFFIKELVYLYTFCEEKMTYNLLSTELHKRDFCHHIRFNNSPDHAQYIDIIKMPNDERSTNKLHHNLLSCSINLQGKFYKIWMVTYKFSNEDLPENLLKNNSIKNTISVSSDTLNNSQQQITKLIDDMINDWAQFSKLYEILIDFTKLTNYTSYLDIFEFNLFNYKKMVLNYGPNFKFTVTIVWKNHENRYALSFGVIDSTVNTNNPHVIVSVQLQDEFNQHKSIANLIKTLNATVNSLSTIHQITCIPMLGLIHSKPHLPIQSFCITPQSSTHLRLIYRNVYCIDIVIQMNGFIAIRDGAYNLFDKTKIFEDLTPIQGLKRFLNRFVDKNATLNRRFSPNDEDNQLSPVAPSSMMETPMESPYTYQNQQQQILKNISSPINVNISLNEGNFNTLANQLQRPPTNYHIHSSNPNTPQNTYMPSPGHPNETSPISRFSVNSPINQVHASSPSTFHQQGMSPAQSMPSPANVANWPNSPMYRPSPRPAQSPAQQQSSHNSNLNQSGPSSVGSNSVHMMRIAPARNWSAAAFPTFLTQSGFESMCRSYAPNENSIFEGSVTFASLSHLERFLGCIFIRRTLQQLILKQDCPLNLIHPSEMGVIQFRDKNELFQFKIQMHLETMQNLQIKMTSLDKTHSITQDEIETLERFFELKVICEPFKPDAFSTFARIITAPLKFIKDFIQLMKLEIYPDPSFKWKMKWCLTISPATLMRNLPLGMSAFVFSNNNSIVFFLQFTQNTQTLAVPVIYEIHKNSMNIPVKDQTIQNLPIINMINRILQDAPNRPEYPIYSSIREVLCSDLIPSV